MLVLKFGGASLASASHIKQAANTVLDIYSSDERIVVVVSAMGTMTDQLYASAKSITDHPEGRELDMLVSSGERISMALLAMALKDKGAQAVSFTGSQSGIITSSKHQKALIKELRPYRIEQALDEGKIAIVAGFQGMSLEKEITTLGRGGSDTSSVALGIALGAREVIFYKDVLGVYTGDPKGDDTSSLIDSMSHDEAERLSSVGSFVIHSRALALAKKHGMALSIQHYDRALRRVSSGTRIFSEKLEPSLVAGYE